jgi:hypothetical protein
MHEYSAVNMYRVWESQALRYFHAIQLRFRPEQFFFSSIHRTTVISLIRIFWLSYGCAVVFRYERIIVEQPDRMPYIPIASLFHRKRTISLCVASSRTDKWPTEVCDVILHLQYASFVE